MFDDGLPPPKGAFRRTARREQEHPSSAARAALAVLRELMCGEAQGNIDIRVDRAYRIKCEFKLIGGGRSEMGLSARGM